MHPCKLPRMTACKVPCRRRNASHSRDARFMQAATHCCFHACMHQCNVWMHASKQDMHTCDHARRASGLRLHGRACMAAPAWPRLQAPFRMAAPAWPRLHGHACTTNLRPGLGACNKAPQAAMHVHTAARLALLSAARSPSCHVITCAHGVRADLHTSSTTARRRAAAARRAAPATTCEAAAPANEKDGKATLA
eukprot:353908-Chlamydomonas_euryale.AAC.3